MFIAKPVLPLLPDLDRSAIVAYYKGNAISRALFLEHVLAVAEILPRRGKVLNLCVDRYAFAVALFAAIARQTITVLPNSAAPAHVAAVATEHEGLLVIGDRASAPIADLPFKSVDEYLVAVTPADLSPAGAPMPSIEFEQPIAYMYTSGSTGTPTLHRKLFGRLRLNILAGAQRLQQLTGGACSVIGTTPIRHMYGLESSVFSPIFGGGCLSGEVPFFPADVARCLEQMPEPRLLVSTPFHLRKLIESDIRLPAVSAVMSATAPLPKELALQIAERLRCRVVEIYGSTETGQLATRLPCEDETWQTLAGVELHAGAGEETVDAKDAIDSGYAIDSKCAGDSEYAADSKGAWAHSEFYESPQPINDVVELESPTRFKLIDRKANIINVAGKRSSLSYLNAAIIKLPGVVDAVFCVPRRETGAEVERLAAFVVAPGVSRSQLLAGLRAHMDPVFLPRPLIFVDALPRDGNGKMAAATLQDLLAKHSASATADAPLDNAGSDAEPRATAPETCDSETYDSETCDSATCEPAT